MAGQASSISFADTLEALGTQTVSSLKGAESVSAAGLQNAAPIKDVVNAVMTAERSLQTALAIRDKAVSAYLEISRMTI
jgi:flagellar hook-basal body complex protein FliE